MDDKANRAQLIDEDEFNVQVTPNSELCEEKVIEVKVKSKQPKVWRY